MKILFFPILLLVANTCFSQNYKITLDAPQYKEGKTYLIYYYGPSMNIQDSAEINASGFAEFKGNQTLVPGVYSIVFPGRSKLYDFLIAKEQQINIKVPDTLDLMNKTIVTGSKENELFQKYQIQISKQGPLLQKELTAYNESKNKADSALHLANYQKLNNDLNTYRSDIIKNQPESMLAALFSAMKNEPKILIANPKNHADSLANYNYYKSHYWDGITFMDDRIIRTPFFIPKLEKYFREIISPSADSVIKESDYMLLLARSSPEMYKFLLNWLTDEYINPQYMGQDAVFVHLFEKYHSKGISNWLNEKQMTAISNRAYMMMSNLVGKTAANLEMLNTKDAKTSLFSINAPYIFVVFWDPTCGHCQTEIPRVDSFYQAKWKKEGVKIFAVLTEIKQKENWLDFIKEHNLGEWTNVYESEAQKKAVEASKSPSYKQLYDVIQTPTVYLLDKDKRIIAKKLTLEQIDNLIDTRIKNSK